MISIRVFRFIFVHAQVCLPNGFGERVYAVYAAKADIKLHLGVIRQFCLLYGASALLSIGRAHV